MSEKTTTKSRQVRMGGGAMMGGFAGKPKNFKKSMSKLLKFLRPHIFWLTVSIVFTAAATVLSVIAPSFLKKLSDELYVSFFGMPINLEQVGHFASVLVIFYGCSLALNYLQSFLMAGITQRVAKKLRTDISLKINKVPLKYFDTHNVGDTLSRVTNDVDTIGQTLNQSITSLISSVIMLVGVLIAMFITSWQMGLTAVATVPLSFLIITLLMKKSQKYFAQQQQSLGSLNAQIEENYSNQAVVKAFNAQQKAQQSFEKDNDSLFKTAKNAQFLSGLMMPAMTLVSNIGYIAICVVGGILFADNKVTLGVITAFFMYVRLFQNPFMQIAQAMNSLQSTAAASERVFEFLEEPEQQPEADTVKLHQINGNVEFRDVKFGYDDDKLVIKGFSATVKAGQKVAIVGPTGAGKTTIINLLMRFYELTSGEILVDGVPISQMSRQDVRNMFGMVLQDTWLFEGTIKENIVYSKQGVSDEEVVAACKAANIHHYITTLPDGYNLVLNDETSISAGQRQLMTIARAMVQNSPMMILDEATSNVDTRTEILIQNAMDKITQGRTSFVIAHRLSTIKNADIILVLKEGDIIESGTHEQLLAQQGFYSQLYNSQFSFEAE